MGRSYYDDNFGHYDIEDEEDLAFYDQVQAESVEKVCEGCCRTVKLRPDYAYCNTCATKLERGYDVDGCGRDSCKRCNPPEEVDEGNGG